MPGLGFHRTDQAVPDSDDEPGAGYLALLDFSVAGPKALSIGSNLNKRGPVLSLLVHCLLGTAVLRKVAKLTTVVALGSAVLGKIAYLLAVVAFGATILGDVAILSTAEAVDLVLSSSLLLRL